MTEPVFFFTEFFWGRCYSWVVSMVGHDDANDNHIYVANLAVDPRALAGLSEPALRLRVGQRPKPIRQIRANAAPILSVIREDQTAILNDSLGVGAAELRDAVKRDR